MTKTLPHEGELLNKWMADNNVSAIQLADALGVTRGNIYYHIKQAEISQEFKNRLVQRNYSIPSIGVQPLDTPKVEGKKVVVIDTTARPSANAHQIDLSQMQIMLVPLVNQFAYAGYLSGFADEEYIENLPKEPFFMDREYKGNYRAFEVRGDSMDDGTKASICDRDIVLGREIIKDYWKNKLHIHKWNFVIVTREDGICYKQISRHDPGTGDITIHSLNPLYEDKEMNLRDVQQLFNVVQINRKQ